jgi:hypothetical protein
MVFGILETEKPFCNVVDHLGMIRVGLSERVPLSDMLQLVDVEEQFSRRFTQ